MTQARVPRVQTGGLPHRILDRQQQYRREIVKKVSFWIISGFLIFGSTIYVCICISAFIREGEHSAYVNTINKAGNAMAETHTVRADRREGLLQ